MNNHVKRIEVIGDLLSSAANSHPNQPFVMCGGGWETYAEIEEQSNRLSGGLQAIGVQKGDRVAVILTNRIEYLVVIYAIAKLGAIQVPINTYLRGEFLRHQLGESQASVIIADDLGLRQVAMIVQSLPNLKSVVAVGDTEIALPVPIEPYAALMNSGVAANLPKVAADDICNILYTSGTTGPSKGCILTHGYYTWNAEALRLAGWVAPGDTIFGANPLFHNSGQVFLVQAALSCGGKVIVEPGFHASTFMRRARVTGATVINGMGAMCPAVLAQPPNDEDRNHNIRQATFVPTSAENWDRFFKRFGIRINSEVYGQTECYPVTITPAGSSHTPDGGAGKRVPYIEFKIVDDDDREVPTGNVGEIVLRPNQPHVMFSGYWNNAEANFRAFRNLWHHTGDNGVVDESGTLYFKDRKKDSMRRRGENVSSMELEAALLKHDGIAAVAVHAVPSELGEDEIKACIVPKPGKSLEPSRLFEFFKESLPYYAIPRFVELMDELPRNPVGRVQKFVLRERGLTQETWDLNALGLVVERSQRRL
jgi:crotonobetaine/carnitine-CoA ligase